MINGRHRRPPSDATKIACQPAQLLVTDGGAATKAEHANLHLRRWTRTHQSGHVGATVASLVAKLDVGILGLYPGFIARVFPSGN